MMKQYTDVPQISPDAVAALAKATVRCLLYTPATDARRSCLWSI